MIMHMHAFRASASFPVTKGCLTFPFFWLGKMNIFNLSWIESNHVIYHC